MVIPPWIDYASASDPALGPVSILNGSSLATDRGGVNIGGMSPTIFREDGFRFYFFSREEPRMHIHVHCADGEAMFWLEPAIELAKNYRLSDRQLGSIRLLIEAHVNEFRSAWIKHFGG